jgi:hypothetical protein
MFRIRLSRLLLLSLVFAATSREAAAQWPQSLSDVVLALPSITSGDTRTYDNARLFDGVVNATIVDRNNNPGDFGPTDLISFQVRPRTGATSARQPDGAGFDFPIVLTRDEFEAWATREENATRLLEVLFPSGLAAALSGRDSSTLYSQQLLMTTILDVTTSEDQRRRPAAALFDTEWIDLHNAGAGANGSAWATQGMYSFSPWVSVHAQYGSLTRALSTSSIGAAVDVHPFIERGDTRDSVLVRIGGMGRGGFLYSSTRPVSGALTSATSIPLPIFDYSGGGWASVLHEFGPVLAGGGALFQVTKHQALEGSDDNFRKAFAAAINHRGLESDVTLGGTAKAPLSRRTSAIGSYAGTFGLDSVIDRPASHAVLGAVMYELGPRATINGGYRTTSLVGGRAHSIFFQGNFGW